MTHGPWFRPVEDGPTDSKLGGSFELSSPSNGGKMSTLLISSISTLHGFERVLQSVVFPILSSQLYHGVSEKPSLGSKDEPLNQDNTRHCMSLS